MFTYAWPPAKKQTENIILFVTRGGSMGSPFNLFILILSVSLPPLPQSLVYGTVRLCDYMYFPLFC